MFQASLRYITLGRRYLGKGGFAIVYTLREVATGELFAAKASTPVAVCLLEARSPQRRRLLRPPAARWLESIAWRRSARARSCSPRFASTARCPTREPPALPPKQPPPSTSSRAQLLPPAVDGRSHIVGFKRCFEDTDNVYILLELCEPRTLSDVSKEGGPLPQPQATALSVSPLPLPPFAPDSAPDGADSRLCLPVVPRMQRPAALPVRRR